MFERVSKPFASRSDLSWIKLSGDRSEVVENKRLDHVLDFIATRQEAREIKRSQKAPRRTGQTNHMF